MKLPDTQNANYQYAFKKGYRLAQEGKSLTSMPSAIRREMDMREYFQQGWNQFQEDIAQAEDQSESPWRNRAAWFLMMILAGIGTASLIIEEMQNRRQPTQVTPESRVLSEQTTTKIDQKPSIALNEVPLENHEMVNDESASLGLLNDAAREDLRLNQLEFAASIPKDITEDLPIEQSTVQIGAHALTTNIQNKSAVDQLKGIVPKEVNKLFFYTQVEGGTGTTIYHRWVYQHKIMATIPLKVKSSPFRTWSSKRLSNAWPGEWTVEVLDEQQRLIFKQSFRYIQ